MFTHDVRLPRGLETTQRYLNITDEELLKALTGAWERRRQLKAIGNVNA